MILQLNQILEALHVPGDSLICLKKFYNNTNFKKRIEYQISENVLDSDVYEYLESEKDILNSNKMKKLDKFFSEISGKSSALYFCIKFMVISIPDMFLSAVT